MSQSSIGPATALLFAAIGCGRADFHVLGGDGGASSDATVPMMGSDSGGTMADGGTADAGGTDGGPGFDAGRIDRCDPLSCSGVPGNVCLGDLCVVGAPESIAFAERNACLVARAPGAVHCLGDNDRGQLGDGTLTASPAFVEVREIANAVRVFVGRRHACALTEAGAVLCWGANDAGQAGSTGGDDALAPVMVAGLPDAPDDLALGHDHTCARVGARVYCWGQNDRGQLGRSGSGGASLGSAIATDAAAVVAGDGFTCVLTRSGVVRCTGRNDRGQLGTGAGADRSSFAEVTGAGSDIAQLAAGDAFACVASATSGARCWGANDAGQLGTGTTTSRATPSDVTGLGGRVMLLALGSRHAYAMLETRAAFAWGDGTDGQIFGAFGVTSSPTPMSVPTAVALAFLAGGTTTMIEDSLGTYYVGGLRDEMIGTPPMMMGEEP
jgi:hypothetical protein